MTQFIEYPSHPTATPASGAPLTHGARMAGHTGALPVMDKNTSHLPPHTDHDNGSVEQYVTYASELKQALDELPWVQINVLVQTLVRAWQTGHHIYIMGNGGSASTATHLACDLAKNTAQPGLPRVQAVSLNDNIAIMSALANDIGYDQIFAEQIRTMVRPMDIVLAISTSGNSPNIIAGIQAAREAKAITIGLCGYHGGKLASMVHVPVITDNHNVEQIEDLHMVQAHMITAAVRKELQQALHRRAGHD